jgi:hypothetical protein
MKNKLKAAHGNWAVGEQFWDREKEIETLTEFISDGAHILLVGQRRIGKTSLMREVARRIGERYICLHIDLQKSNTPADAVVELSIATKPYAKLWDKTRDIFRNVLYQVRNSIESLKIDDIAVTLRSGVTSGDWKIKGDRLFATLADSEKPVVLFFDEVAILVNRILKGSNFRITSERIQNVDEFMSWLRDNSIRHKGKVRMILSGSIGIESVLRQAGLSATLNTFSPFDLKAWDIGTAIGCLEALANEYGISFQQGVCERIVERLGCCIPHHVQMFFDGIYTDFKLRGQTEVMNDIVDEIYSSRMLGVRGHAELNHFEERLKMVLGSEVYPLALELLTETAVSGKLTTDAAFFLGQQYAFEDRSCEDVLREILGILEHDGYLWKDGMEYKFISNLLRDWWKARFEFFYTPVSMRRN